MSVNQYINGKLNLIAGGYGSGGGECGCEENTFTGTMEEVQAAIAAGEIKDDFIIFVTDDFEEISSDNKIEYVTQEEYDALPDSKLTDDVEYRITDKGIDSVSASNVKYDGSASGLSAMNVQGAVDEVNGKSIYSTEEKVVGTWIDGKPIYRKIVKFADDTVGTESKVQEIDFPNVEKLVSLKGNLCWYNKNQQYPIPFVVLLSQENWINVDLYLSDTNKLRLRYHRSIGSSPMLDVYAIVEYTKTTD